MVIFFVVEAVLLYTLFKYRRRPGREAAQFHGNTRLEVILTLIPALILAGISVPTVRTIFDLANEPVDALRVNVVAHQFWWQYTYPDLGIVAVNELHIPTEQPVRVTMQGALQDPIDGSPEVIHSFWLPRLAGKQDIVPGRTTHVLLEADRPGTYYGQCTEFCGLGHANMRIRAIAQTQEEFEAWVEDQKEPAAEPSSGLAAEGAQLFAEGAEGGQFAAGPACASCHAVESAALENGDAPPPNAGPNLAHFASRRTFAGAVFQNNTQNLEAWLRDPPAVKQGAKMPDVGLTQEQIDALVAYLQTLE